MMALEEEAMAAPAASPYSFTAPDNFTPPDDYEEGKPFDVVASMVLSNGNLILKALNGTQLAQEEAEEEMPEEEETETEEVETEQVEDDMEEDDAAENGAALLKDLQSITR